MNYGKFDSVKYILYTYHFSELEGKLLTIIDASPGDKEQRKALKDLTRQTMWNHLTSNNQCEVEGDIHNKKLEPCLVYCGQCKKDVRGDNGRCEDCGLSFDP